MTRAKLVGQPLTRVEDQRFLTGNGCYTDDLTVPGACFGAVVRSPHAHARLVAIDTEAARSLPGVRAVLTGEGLPGLVSPLPSVVGFDPALLTDRNGRIPPEPPHWPLARDKVRHVGDPVAFVVADSSSIARLAAEHIDVTYAALTPVISFEAAESGAVKVWEGLASNTSFEWEQGDAEALDSAFAKAAHVTRVELDINRQKVVFMEPRSVIAEYDPANDSFTVHAGCQSAHSIQAILAMVLGHPPERVRVVVGDTGGGFGARNVVYPEFVLCALAARQIGRPVRWTAERGESFLTDTQARDQRVIAELALDENGEFLGIRARVLWRHGAYLPARSLMIVILFMAPMMCGAYRIPCTHFEMLGLFSNTAPVHAFRGIGRAEAAYILERLVDTAARETGRDRVELRRINLIAADNMPVVTAAGAQYGRCELSTVLEQALTRSRWESFEERRQKDHTCGRLRGIGLALYLESTGGAPSEFAEVEAAPAGVVNAYVGTQNFGMGHETVFAQVLADELALPIERIRIINGDTAKVRQGFGSHASRSMRIGGGALVHGARALIERARELASDYLEAASADIDYTHGKLVIRGTDRGIDLFDLATRVAGDQGRVSADAVFHTNNHAYANGCHVCEVSIDPDTGRIEIAAHTLVTDVGRVVNPLITHGQLHGGIAQGIGQAVLEQVVYEPHGGQLLSASLMDYSLPRADDLPTLDTSFHEVVCEDNPLGAKGAGEGPTTGSPPAVVNAIIDALSGRGISRLDMPATGERVWRLIAALD